MGLTSSKWRLDKMLLEKAANDNVRVYILLYWETRPVMDLGNYLVESFLKHDNIKVLTRLVGLYFLW